MLLIVWDSDLSRSSKSVHEYNAGGKYFDAVGHLYAHRLTSFCGCVYICLISGLQTCYLLLPYCLFFYIPLPPLGHIWDVMLVWRKGNIENKTVSVVVCTIIMAHCDCLLFLRLRNTFTYLLTKVQAGRSNVSGFDLAWFSSLSSERLCLRTSWCCIYVHIKNFFLYPLYLLVSWTWLDWPLTWLTNHRPSVLWHLCWLSHAGGTVHQMFNTRWPCLPSGFGTCVEQPAVVCQECTVADDVPSQAEDCTFPVVVWKWLGDRDCTAQYNCCLPMTTDCRRFCHFVFLLFLILYGAPAMSLTWQCHLNQYIVTYLLTYGWVVWPIKSSPKWPICVEWDVKPYYTVPYHCFLMLFLFTRVLRFLNVGWLRVARKTTMSAC